jgi:hypothetical protein
MTTSVLFVKKQSFYLKHVFNILFLIGSSLFLEQLSWTSCLMENSFGKLFDKWLDHEIPAHISVFCSSAFGGVPCRGG